MSKKEADDTEKVKEYMRVTEYAVYRQISKSEVSLARKDGLIRYYLVDGIQQVKVAEADEAFDKKKAARAEAVENQNEKMLSYDAARAVKENYNAKIKKLEHERLEETLIDKAQAIKLVETIGFQVKESMRQLPQKMSAMLAAETDPMKIELAMMKEIDQALTAIADGKL